MLLLGNIENYPFINGLEASSELALPIDDTAWMQVPCGFYQKPVAHQ
jgi:hypothetical protein